MPVYKLMEEMPYEEFVNWFEYFRQRPVGWRDDERTFKLLQAQGVKAKPEEIFSSFATMRSTEKTSVSDDGSLNHSKFQNSGMLSQLLGAKGGEKIGY